MEDYQLRVIEEKRELDKKINSLENFIQGPKSSNLPKREKSLLRLQLVHMEKYSEVLEVRIDNFEE